MSLTISELTTAPSSDDLFNAMIAWLVEMGLPADKWREGGVARSILRVVALTFATLALLISDFAAGAYLDTATGDWLTNLAKFVYGVTRPQATFATGTVLASNSSGGTYTYPPGAFIVLTGPLAQNPGKAYTNTTLFTLNPGDSAIPVPVIASELGSASNANPGDINTMGIGDAGVSVTNPAAVFGLDAMTDANLRALCLAKLGALSIAGPRGAYIYAIGVAMNGTAPVNVNRKAISPSSSTGVVTIYVASPSGTVSAGDLAAIKASIEAIARPDSVTVNVFSASVVAYAPTLTVWARNTPGLDAPTLSELVDEAVAAFVAGYDIGGLPKPPSTSTFLYAEEITAKASSADPSIFACDIDLGDLPLAPGQVATITPTINVHFVTAPQTS